jgi:hypothetical protein
MVRIAVKMNLRDSDVCPFGVGRCISSERYETASRHAEFVMKKLGAEVEKFGLMLESGAVNVNEQGLTTSPPKVVLPTEMTENKASRQLMKLARNELIKRGAWSGMKYVDVDPLSELLRRVVAFRLQLQVPPSQPSPDAARPSIRTLYSFYMDHRFDLSWDEQQFPAEQSSGEGYEGGDEDEVGGL